MTGYYKAILAIILVLVTTAGFLFGRLSVKQQPVAATTTICNDIGMEQQRMGGYSFINPLLECDYNRSSQINSVTQMNRRVSDYIQQAQKNKKANFVAVYFRDLNFGPWLGINENETFSPASLLTVPIMIAAFKTAETDPSFLEKEILYNPKDKRNVSATDSLRIQPGKSYKMEELIKHMVKYSDLEARSLVQQQMDDKFIKQVMSDIGVRINGEMDKALVSVKDYSGFFRLLYNATFLNRKFSEKALEILVEAEFSKGIAAGLPKGVALANKYSQTIATADEQQLHECAIVYFSGSPYLLSIVSRGNDANQLATVLADISAIVYQERSKS